MRQLVRENRPGRESWGGRGVVWKERVGGREGIGLERERRGIERA